MKLISDILGFGGILFTIALYQQRKRESLLLYKLILDVVWIGHYAFIGAFSGAAVCVIAAVRELIFYKRDKDKRNGIIWLPIYIILAVVCTELTWDNNFSVFTFIASCIAVVSFFIAKPKLSRILAFPVSLCMLTYDIACGSVAGIVDQCVAMSSSLIGMLRLDRKMKKEESAIK